MRLTGHALSSHSFLITSYAGIAHAFGIPLGDFLHEHTVLPYMTAYMPATERHRMSLEVARPKGRQSRTASLVRRSVTGQVWLRMCESCAAEELERLGESYWHRVHQLTGVDICITHDRNLCVTSVKIDRGPSVPPPHEAPCFGPAKLDVARPIAYAIALASAEALWAVRVEDSSPLAYREIARNLGYVYSSRKVHGSLFSHDLTTFFGAGYLEKHGCAIGTGNRGLWPAKLLQESALHTTTFKHILLKVFLDASPSPSFRRADSQGRCETKLRDWKQIEQDAIACLAAEVARHKAAGTRVSLTALYELTSLRTIVLDYKHRVPQLMAWVQNFRMSPQSARVPGRRRKK